VSEIAVAGLSVELDDEGNIVQIVARTNTDSWAFWRPIIDQLWVDEVRKEGTGQASQESDDD